MSTAKKLSPLDETQKSYNLKITSFNNFPTACGLASSASGYAALAAAVIGLYKIDLKYLSELARLGSGSACRSTLPGFVQWQEDEVQQVQGFQLDATAILVNPQAKDLGSTEAMAKCLTDPEVQARAESILPGKLVPLLKALETKDFQTIADITISESNELHSICQKNGIKYLSQDSEQIISLVLKFRADVNQGVCYTFDAGPNAFIISLPETTKQFYIALLEVASVEGGYDSLNLLAKDLISEEEFNKLQGNQEGKLFRIKGILRNIVGDQGATLLG